jgi:hypothetical protein
MLHAKSNHKAEIESLEAQNHVNPDYRAHFRENEGYAKSSEFLGQLIQK